MTRRPFVLIEGADGTGKTTLANALVERGWGIEHAGPPTYEPLAFYLDAVRRHPYGHAVLDRLHIGSFVYGTIFRGMDDLTPYEHWQIEGTLMGYNSLLVWANPPASASDANVAAGPIDEDAAVYEAPAMQAQVRQLYEAYVGSITALPWISYDFTVPGALESAIAEIEGIVGFFESSPMPLGSWFGNGYSPRLCLVGDAPNRYLFRAMVGAGIPLNQVCVVESLDGFDGSDFWMSTEFVAFGDAGEAACEAAGVTEYRSVPSATLWSAERYKDVVEYGRLIDGASGRVTEPEVPSNITKFPTLEERGFTVV